MTGDSESCFTHSKKRLAPFRFAICDEPSTSRRLNIGEMDIWRAADRQYEFERNQFINPGEDFTPEPPKVEMDRKAGARSVTAV